MNPVYLPQADSVGRRQEAQKNPELLEVVKALIRHFSDYTFVEQESRALDSVSLRVSSPNKPDVPILVRRSDGGLWLDINGDSYQITGAILKLVGSGSERDLSPWTIKTITPDLELATME
jgi:hypothetical protein